MEIQRLLRARPLARARVRLVDWTESVGSSPSLTQTQGTVKPIRFWFLSWNFGDLIEVSNQLQNLWNFKWSLLILGLTSHKISRDFHALHFSLKIPEGQFKCLTKVWLASKIIQIISKNYEIIQRCQQAFLEPGKNIFQGLDIGVWDKVEKDWPKSIWNSILNSTIFWQEV